MKTRLLLTVASMTLFVSCASSPKPISPHPLAGEYLDGLFRAKPHLATFMGDHRFDGRLPDLSPEGLKAREAELVDLQAKLAQVRPANFDQEIDGEILRDGIALELLYLREIREWERDPRLYDTFPYYDPREIVAGRLSDIIHGSFAPEDVRRASVRAQLEALPLYLAQVQAALAGSPRAPSREHLDQGLKGNRGRIEFFETELKEFTAPHAEAEAARLKALEALRAYQLFLEGDLAKRPSGDWRLGAELYRKKFPLALQTDLTPDAVIPVAEASFREAKAELLAVAAKLHGELWPAEAKLDPAALVDPAAQKAVIDRVKEELSKDHSAPEALVASHGKNLEALRSFIREHDLLDLPASETLTVEPMPAFKRGSSAAEYLAPGALDPSPEWRAVYYVDPIDPTWSADRIESYLRGQNDYEVQLVASHEAYPGHHTQYYYSKRNLDPVRAVLWNAAMVEGWAVYGEGLMVSLGWGGVHNDRFRFYDLRGRMIVATNIVIDIKLHSGSMSEEEAVRFMVEEGFQEKAMAEKKLLRAKLDTTQLAQYFLGHHEILALEKEYRAKLGAAWTQRAFDEALIGRGSIAVRYLRRYMMEGK